jgi:DNA-binding CsgD family transcriptional regulator
MLNLLSDFLKEIFRPKPKPPRSLKSSLRMRFYVVSAFVIVTMSAILYSALLASGLIDFGYRSKNLVFTAEMENMASAMEKRFGVISSMALQMGARVSKNTEKFLKTRNLPINDLRLDPGRLKDLLASQFDPLMLSLAQARTTGAFVIFNATSSARMQEAMISRAGLYIIDWEPGLVTSGMQQFQLLRGPADIAVLQDLVMEQYWAMEFNIEDAGYYTAPQKYASAYPELARRICLWSPMVTIRGSAYRAMLCSVPLADSEGNVFGVCGFDVSEQYFREAFSPSMNTFEKIFCVLAPMEDGRLDMSRSLISWRSLVDEKPVTGRVLSVIGSEDGLNVYADNAGGKYIGLQKILKLHSSGLPFNSQEFAFAFLVPLEQYGSARFERRMAVAGIFALIIVVGALVSYLINKWFIRPMIAVIDAMGENADDKAAGSPDADIAGFEGLLASIREQHAEDKPRLPETETETETETEPAGEGEKEPPLPDVSDKHELAEKLKTLSSAEKKVFDLYIEGFSGPDISQTLNISLNTVKTHTRNIMAKMRAGSKRELISANIKMLRDENKSGN